MSATKQTGYWGNILDAIRGRGPALQDQMSKFGARMVLFPGFFIRQEALLRHQHVMGNYLLDPVDKVHEAHALLTSIGLPYAEGAEIGSRLWTFSWNLWNGAFFEYDNTYASQRKWYRKETLLTIAEFLPVHTVTVQDSGESKVDTSWMRVERQVRPQTWDAIRIVDSVQAQSPKKPTEWRPSELVEKADISPDPKYERLKEMVGYDELGAEESIKIASAEVQSWAFAVLNRSFTMRNTPGQAETIFMQNMMTGPQQGRSTGQSAPPDWGLSPADKEQR